MPYKDDQHKGNGSGCTGHRDLLAAASCGVSKQAPESWGCAAIVGTGHAAK
jgi:hypothetical protein